MNIIVLLESISLDKSRIGSFAASDFTEIKKQLIAQKEVHPEIEDSDIAQLMKALKSNAAELQAIVSNRVLFNFFAKTDYPRTSFTPQADPIDAEKIKAFVQANFAEELSLFFNQNLDANKFDQVSVLAEAHGFFPDGLNFSLRQHALDKLDDAIEALKPPYGNFSKIMYIKDSNFFVFLNHIKDEGIEARVESFFNTVKNFYNQNNGSELAGNSFAAMNKYIPMDKAFGEKIKSYREVAESNIGNYAPKRRNLTWVYIVVGVFVLVRVVIFINMSNFGRNDSYDDDSVYEDETEYSSEAPKIDSYYTNMKYDIDSFQTFLTGFKESEIRQLTKGDSWKTGENPFETFYENPPAEDSSNFITISNKTGYDMVLLENAVMYDSLKMPRTAHFIKSGDNLEINFKNSNYSETVFNMYLGKKLANFQTDKGLFVRNHSIVEYRFSELVANSKEILKTDYCFINDAVISYSKNGLNIDSPGAKINPLKSATD